MSDFRVALHPGQAAIFNSPARFKICAAGRRFGKSHFAAYMLAIAALQETNYAGYKLSVENGVFYVAPTFDQAKRIMWPKMHALLGFEQKGGLIRNENVNDGWLELINGRRIYIRGADNPDSLRGAGYQYVVLDEYADMKANVWTEIIDPALADVEGEALFIGTPKGKNHFYRLFMNALTKPISKTTGTDAAWKDWEAFHFKTGDNPFMNKKEIERLMNSDNRSLEIIKQEIEASFISGGGSVLKPEWFEIVDKAPPIGQGSIYITVDLAGFVKQEGNKIMRSDETVVCETMLFDDTWYVLNMQHGHWDVRQAAQQIILAARRYPVAQLGIEAGALKNAVGPYLDEYMREYSRYMTPQPLLHGHQKKADRIAWALQGRGQRGLIKLVKGPWNDWLLDQMADFPSPLAHDDGIDALAYVDQLAKANYADFDDIEEWEAVDLDSGY
jgi:hypothetical protein